MLIPNPKFEMPPIGSPDDLRGIGKKLSLLANIVGKPGHKVSHCAKVPLCKGFLLNILLLEWPLRHS